MTTIRDICPICGGRLALVQLECQQCHTRLEGDAAVLAAPSEDRAAREGDAGRYGVLARLSAEQLSFVATFIRARGIIKTVEAMLGISYPTVRSKLDDVVATMGLSPTDERASGEVLREQRDIVADLAEGRLTPEEAHERLRRLAQGDGAGTTTTTEGGD
jgi:hypothetical protein